MLLFGTQAMQHESPPACDGFVRLCYRTSVRHHRLLGLPRLSVLFETVEGTIRLF